jgi:hypothetical protein
MSYRTIVCIAAALTLGVAAVSTDAFAYRGGGARAGGGYHRGGGVAYRGGAYRGAYRGGAYRGAYRGGAYRGAYRAGAAAAAAGSYYNYNNFYNTEQREDCGYYPSDCQY